MKGDTDRAIIESLVGRTIVAVTHYDDRYDGDIIGVVLTLDDGRHVDISADMAMIGNEGCWLKLDVKPCDTLDVNGE